MTKVSSSSLQRPLILSNDPLLSPKIFAYYSVLWEQNQSTILHDNNVHLEINSCLYFQNLPQSDKDDDESEEVREDGCGYVITYPAKENLEIYNFDRMKDNNSKPFGDYIAMKKVFDDLLIK